MFLLSLGTIISGPAADCITMDVVLLKNSLNTPGLCSAPITIKSGSRLFETSGIVFAALP